MVEEKKLICQICKQALEEDYPVVWDSKLIHEKCFNKIRKNK